MAHHVSFAVEEKPQSAFYMKPYRKKEYRDREKPSLEETSAKVQELTEHARELFPQYSSSSDFQGESWCFRNAPVLLTGGTIAGGFLVLLVNTIISWSTQTLWHNLGQSASLALITIGSGKAWHTYSRNKKAAEVRREEMKLDLQIEFTQNQLLFLQKCLQTVGVAMRQDYSEFPTAYLELSLAMDTAEEGIVPPDLKTKWEMIGDLIHAHAESSEQGAKEMAIEEIREFIEKRIIPRIHYYSKQLKERLTTLRNSSLADESKRDSSESKKLLGLSPLRDYKTGGSIQETP